MKKYFKESKWKRFNLTKWQFIYIDNVIIVNSNLFVTECFQKLCVDLNDVQKNWILIITIWIICEKSQLKHAEIIRFYWLNYTIRRRISQIWLIFFISISSIMSQSTKRITDIFKALTLLIIFIIMILSTNNIIANLNQSIIVTIVNSWLILDLVIDFRFAFRKSVSYVINSIVNRRIILKRNTTISKSALQIVISY
jgi:hypothetical protein